MLAEEFDDPGWAESEDCGCWVAKLVIDGVEVDAHHWIPDDSAPHVPSTECGCSPVRREEAEGVILFEHWDQDDADVSKLWAAAGEPAKSA